MPPSVRPVLSYHLCHLMDVILLSPPYKPPTRTFIRMIRNLWSMGAFMALCAVLPRSLLLFLIGIPKAAPEHTDHHSPPPSLIDLITFWPPLWCNLHLAHRNASSGLTSLGQLILCVLFPRLSLAFDMPHLRGKAKRGSSWYEARGRNLPTPDHPPEAKFSQS
jgi:hypothetical protein